MTIALFHSRFIDGVCRDPDLLILETRSMDAAADQRPDIWVYVHRDERYEYHQGTKDVREATIRLTFEAVDEHSHRVINGGSFHASYSELYGRISLTGLSPTGRGGVMIPDGLRGRRIGTYLFNTIVGWAKQWPDAMVNSVNLSEVDAYEGNHQRRNRFYEQFGLIFDYSDDACRGGDSKPMPAGRLNQVTTWEQNVTVKRVPDQLARLAYDNFRLRQEIAARERAIDHFRDQVDRQQLRPIRTLLATLWAKHAQVVGLSVVTAIVLAEAARELWHI